MTPLSEGTDRARAERGRRRVERGRVTSAKMEKTVVVSVTRRMKHPKYGKYLERTTRYFAHDEKREAGQGDWVEIQETRPLSRRKRWRLVRVVERARTPEAAGGEGEAAAAEAAGAAPTAPEGKKP